MKTYKDCGEEKFILSETDLGKTINYIFDFPGGNRMKKAKIVYKKKNGDVLLQILDSNSLDSDEGWEYGGGGLNKIWKTIEKYCPNYKNEKFWWIHDGNNEFARFKGFVYNKESIE